MTAGIFESTFDVTLTDEATGEYVHLWPTPEGLPGSEDVAEYSWALAETGEVSLPRGPNAGTFSLSGWLPGEHDAARPWAPLDFQLPIFWSTLLRKWRRDGTILRLLVVGTDLDSPVYVRSYSRTWGELDRLHYELTLVEAAQVIVNTVSLQDATTERGAGGGGRKGAKKRHHKNPYEGAKPVPDTHTVQSGDSLSLIAKRYYNDPGRWPDIYDANAALIGDDPSLIQPGQVLKIPGGKPTDENKPRPDPSLPTF